jgi:hypothetical protein
VTAGCCMMSSSSNRVITELNKISYHVMSCHNYSHQQLPANVTLMSKIAENGLPLSYFASCVFLCGKFTFISSDHYDIIMLASVWLFVTFCNMYYVFYRDKGHNITYLCRHRVEEEV